METLLVYDSLFRLSEAARKKEPIDSQALYNLFLKRDDPTHFF
jgi:hypothetical protein